LYGQSRIEAGMNDTDKQQQHWQELADELGAESPEASEGMPAIEESVTELPAAELPPPSPKRSRDDSERSQGPNWSLLADELGLEPMPTAEPPAAEVPEELAGDEADEEAVEEAKPEEFAAVEEPSDTRDWAPPAEDEERIEVAQEEPVAEEEAETDQDPLSLDSEPFVDEVAEALDLETDEEIEEAEATQGQEEAPPRPRRRRRGGRRRRRADAPDADSTATEDVEEAEPKEEMEVDREEEAAVADEGPPEPTTRKRRRRRRRAPRGEREAGEPKDAAEDADLDDEDDDGEELPEGADQGRRAAKHRKIPSWAEAIGVIIEGNLASRSRGQGGSRGRGRRS
jgi:ribonuclease E